MIDLSRIRVLWRQPDTMALFGIPHDMRRDVGQEPRHLTRDGVPAGWIWLGSPGWWGSMLAADIAIVSLWLLTLGDEIPDGPGEWCTVSG